MDGEMGSFGIWHWIIIVLIVIFICFKSGVFHPYLFSNLKNKIKKMVTSSGRETPNQIMPKHIKYFEWTWLGSLALGIIVSALSYSATVPAGMEIFAGLVQFFVLGAMLLLILLTSRKRSNIAKWVLVVFFGLGIVFYIPQLADLFRAGFVGVLSSVQVLAQCVGIYFLFTPESRDWFRVVKTN